MEKGQDSLSWTRDVTESSTLQMDELRWEDDLKRWCAARDLETGFAKPDLVEATCCDGDVWHRI